MYVSCNNSVYELIQEASIMKTFNTIFLSLLIIIISSCSKDEPTSPNQSGIPSKPKNLNPKYEDSIVVLKWETPDNTGSPIITKYLIYRKSGSSSYENIGFTVYNTTTYKDTSVIILNSYSYYVTAINTDGESEKSNEISATPYSFGFNGRVNSLAVNGNDVYAGGEFTSAGGVSAINIAKWNGTNWSALGSGLNGTVRSIAINGNDIYAGGYFTTAGGVSANNIAIWNGSNWSALGSGVNDYVNAIGVSGNDVYAGGQFTIAGGGSAYNIAKWNGTNWSALGSGLNGSVNAIGVSGNDVYAGGVFTIAGGVSANRIAKWNGSSWSALGNGLNYKVYALEIIGNDVYAGGEFSIAGGQSAKKIAKWNGSEWSGF
ncbi:MAG: fibronectin type III domain-containing protein, partial [Ignavibacteria bacterium]